MKITSREKDIIERAADALHDISIRAESKMTERYFERIANMLDQIWYDFSEDEKDEDED